MDSHMERSRDRCIRCGECCLKASPTLQIGDISIVKHNVINLRDIYTIRKGELVRDNVNGGLIPAPQEMIKIKEMRGERSGCVFYDDLKKACRIYERRPVQCSALKCWDTREFMKVYRGRKLKRNDLIEDGILIGVIEEHEKRCSYDVIDNLVREIEVAGEKAIGKILDLLRFDHQLRPLISERLGLDPDEYNFFFGRPLIKTIRMFGLKVIQESTGSFLFTTAKPVNT